MSILHSVIQHVLEASPPPRPEPEGDFSASIWSSNPIDMLRYVMARYGVRNDDQVHNIQCLLQV